MSESYTTGGDTLYEITPPALIGQTFSPLHAHKLAYIDINAKVATIGGDLSAYLFDLATSPNMDSGAISYTKSTNWPPRWWYELGRVRFNMRAVNVQVGHTYGILIRSNPPTPWAKHQVQYDQGDATYPRGQLFLKADLGAPPVYYPLDDLMFVEFGEPPPPPPILIPPKPSPPMPLNPPVDHWYIRGSELYDTGTGYNIYTWTDVPCHLFMRWTTEEPWFHKIPVLRRGLFLHADVRMCFVAYEDNEQQEAGDTIMHTFVKDPWPICETRYFYFWGTVKEEEMPSTSGLFSQHRKAPLIPQPEDCQPIVTFKQGFGQYYLAMGQTFQPIRNYELKKIQVWVTRHNDLCGGPVHIAIEDTTNDPYRGVELTSIDVDAGAWKYDRIGFDMKEYNFGPLALQAGVLYRIVMYCLPGWWPSDIYAAIYWDAHTPDPYPRGRQCWGYNYKDDTGYWEYADLNDRGFCLLGNP